MYPAKPRPPRYPYVEHARRALDLPPDVVDGGDIEPSRHAESMRYDVIKSDGDLWTYVVATQRVTWGDRLLNVAYFPTAKRVFVSDLGPLTKSGR